MGAYFFLFFFLEDTNAPSGCQVLQFLNIKGQVSVFIPSLCPQRRQSNNSLATNQDIDSKLRQAYSASDCS